MLKGILTVAFIALCSFLGSFLMKVLFCRESNSMFGANFFLGLGAGAWIIMLIISLSGLVSGGRAELGTNLTMLGASLAIAGVVAALSVNAHKKAREQALANSMNNDSSASPDAAEAENEVPANDATQKEESAQKEPTRQQSKSLREHLEYALRYSTDSGMRSYLKSIRTRVNDEELVELDALLDMPEDRFRSEIEAAVREM